MAANKVVFGNKVLIDLTGDTVTEEALLKGYTAHKADGTIITGTAFAGYPNEFVFLDNIQEIEVVKFVWVSFISRLFLHLNPLGTVNAG